MSDPVTVFMLVVAGLLVVGTVGEQVFARTGVPTVIWLVLLGVLVRIADIVPAPVIKLLAPFFAALALVIILFDAGTNLNGGLTGGTGEETLSPANGRRALLLAGVGFAVCMLLAALLSMGLAALEILPAWSWGHAFMLGALVSCGASEVFMPTLQTWPVGSAVTGLLRRESAITKALAVTATVVCLDLLSPRVAVGGAGLAMVAGFGFALAFGGVAGMLWVVALQRLAGAGRGSGGGPGRDYGFTLAVMMVLYVLSEAAGGAGALSVLVFGAMLGNADALLRLLRSSAAGASEDRAASEAVHAALAGHERTIGFVRTLVFAMVGLTLAPPWGPIVMGVALAFVLLIGRLAVARFALSGLEFRERSIIGACAPRGMATVALVTLPLAHAVRGAEEMVALVFSAVTTSVLLFTVGMFEVQRGMRRTPVVPRPRPMSLGSMVAAEVAGGQLTAARGEAGAAGNVGSSAVWADAPTLAIDTRAVQAAREGAQAAGEMNTLPQVGPAVAEMNTLPQVGPAAAVRADDAGSMHTLPQVGPAGTRVDDARSMRTPPQGGLALPRVDEVTAQALQRALARRPEEVTNVSRRPTAAGSATLPPLFTAFADSGEDDVLARLGVSDEGAAGEKKE